MSYKKEFVKNLFYQSPEDATLALQEYRSRILSDGTPLTKTTAAFVRGEITMLIGREGAGKTTLVRTLAKGFTDNNYLCGFMLTEETISDYRLGLAGSSFLKKEKIPMYSIYEQAYMSGLPKAESDDVWNSMPLVVDKFITKNNLDVLFLDNMTTNKSVLEYNLSEQTELFLQLKAIAYVRKCSIVLIYHTGKQVRDNVFENADIEGSNAPAKLSPNILLHYNFKESKKAVVKINKVRFDGGMSGEPYHLLEYQNGLYKYLRPASYNAFNDLLKHYRQEAKNKYV